MIRYSQLPPTLKEKFARTLAQYIACLQSAWNGWPTGVADPTDIHNLIRGPDDKFHPYIVVKNMPLRVEATNVWWAVSYTVLIIDTPNIVARIDIETMLGKLSAWVSVPWEESYLLPSTAHIMVMDLPIGNVSPGAISFWEEHLGGDAGKLLGFITWVKSMNSILTKAMMIN